MKLLEKLSENIEADRKADHMEREGTFVWRRYLT